MTPLLRPPTCREHMYQRPPVVNFKKDLLSIWSSRPGMTGDYREKAEGMAGDYQEKAEGVL